jgi:histidyl-tRNA synthetase
MSIQKPKGTQDFLPGAVETWQHVEDKARQICRRFNFKEIRTPVFESTELFRRGVGETTDIVEKEMYTFMDRGERSNTLRPEGTAGVVRSYVENKLHGDPDMAKLYYIGPMFRYERQQAGRYRQFHQFGVEAIGSEEPALDAEVIALGYQFYTELGLRGISVELNSVGTPEDRERYRNRLLDFLNPIREQLCGDCQSRIERNPLRVLDCKKDQDKFTDAPSIIDDLAEGSRKHYDSVKEYLVSMDIPYLENPRLVRGLDYYTHTAFEYKAQGIGSIDTIGGGGRYNGLVSQIGGEDRPGVGLGIGLERTILLLEDQKVNLNLSTGIDVYLIAYGEEAERRLPEFLHRLRSEGVSAERDYQHRKPKNLWKAAERAGARYVLNVGDEELQSGTAELKSTAGDAKWSVRLDELAEKIRSINTTSHLDTNNEKGNNHQ